MWVILGSINSMFEWWQGWRFKGVKKIFWELIPPAILWSIWRVRNDVLFEGKQVDWVALLDLIKWRIAFWAKTKNFACHLSFDGLFNLQVLGEGL